MTLAYDGYTGAFLGFVYANINGIAFIRGHDGAVTARPHAALYRSHRAP